MPNSLPPTPKSVVQSTHDVLIAEIHKLPMNTAEYGALIAILTVCALAIEYISTNKKEG